MRRKTEIGLVIVLLALAGCSVPQPSNVEVDAPPGAEDAASIVVDAWVARLPHGSRVGSDDMPPIRWFSGDCLVYDDSDAGCSTMGGYSTAPGAAPEIHLLLRPTLHESALAHEVLHWMLDEIAGDDDQEHVGPDWPRVGEVQAALAEAGL